MGVRFRALTSWPAVSGSSRTGMRLSGKVAYPVILKRFEAELSELKAKDVWVESGHDGEDLRLDGHLRAGAKPPRFPGVIVRLYADAVYGMPGSAQKPLGPLWFHCNTYDNWEANLWAIAMTMERLRGIATYGTVSEAEIYGLFADTSPQASQPGAQPSDSDSQKQKRSARAKQKTTNTGSSKTKVNQPPPENFVKLRAARFLLREAQEEDTNAIAHTLLINRTEAKRVFILAAKKAHPDLGGTDDRMRAVNEAWEVLTSNAQN